MCLCVCVCVCFGDGRVCVFFWWDVVGYVCVYVYMCMCVVASLSSENNYHIFCDLKTFIMCFFIIKLRE